MRLRNKIPELIGDLPIAKLARQIDAANQTARNYVSKIEYFDGDSQETIGTLISIANALNVPFSDLFELEE